MRSYCSQNPNNLEPQKSVKDFKLVPSGIIETVEELEKSKYFGIFCFGETLEGLGFLAYGGPIFGLETGRYLILRSCTPAMRLEVKS